MSMSEKLTDIKRSCKQAVAAAQTLEELAAVRVGVLGKKGSLTAVMHMMGGLSAEERPLMGKRANEVRCALTQLSLIHI